MTEADKVSVEGQVHRGKLDKEGTPENYMGSLPSLAKY